MHSTAGFEPVPPETEVTVIKRALINSTTQITIKILPLSEIWKFHIFPGSYPNVKKVIMK